MFNERQGESNGLVLFGFSVLCADLLPHTGSGVICRPISRHCLDLISTS
ncbi:hypothetical protein OROHE_001929 [Orobanche hederae]